MVFTYFVTNLIIIIHVTHCVVCFENYTLPEIKLVNVVFRHGDRTPELVYPNIRGVNQSYYPMGLASLTNKGKLRAYQLGELLRLRYSNLLGTTYIPDDVYAQSTDYGRTKMTLQLVLAGLYPPDSLQLWNTRLDWQPIPINYVPQEQDVLLNRVYICKSIEKEQNQVLQLTEVKTKLKSYLNLTKDLTFYLGVNITTPRDIFTLYCDLKCLKQMDVNLPIWADDLLHNNQFLEAALIRLELVNYNKILKRINGGPLVSKIIQNMKDAINGSEEKRKIFLYSSHDINIYALLSALNVVVPHAPEFTSAVIVELLYVDNNYFVKILYYLGVPSEVKELQIPECSSPCTLDNFINLTKGVIPSDDEINCL